MGDLSSVKYASIGEIHPYPLLLYYDEYHTPLDALSNALGALQTIRILFGQHGHAVEADPADVRQLDRTAWFADHYLGRAIRSGARYQRHYNLSAALARPALAEIVAELVAEGGNDSVVHGFAGNDQLRFESALATLCPGVAIRSVVDVLGSRTCANADDFTRSCNLWGATLEAGSLGDPGFGSADMAFAGRDPPARDATEIVIMFEQGLPISIGGERLPLADLIARLTEIGTAAGIAWHDLVEDGHVGLKTRALYHNPAADILAAAHADLVRITSSRRENRFRPLAEAAWAELVYEGGWFDPLREVLDAYFAAADRHVTGEVRVAIRSGQLRVVGRTTSCALYDERAAVYRAGQDFGASLIRGLRDQEAQLGRLALEREGARRCDG